MGGEGGRTCLFGRGRRDGIELLDMDGLGDGGEERREEREHNKLYAGRPSVWLLEGRMPYPYICMRNSSQAEKVGKV